VLEIIYAYAVFYSFFSIVLAKGLDHFKSQKLFKIYLVHFFFNSLQSLNCYNQVIINIFQFNRDCIPNTANQLVGDIG